MSCEVVWTLQIMLCIPFIQEEHVSKGSVKPPDDTTLWVETKVVQNGKAISLEAGGREKQKAGRTLLVLKRYVLQQKGAWKFRLAGRTAGQKSLEADLRTL